MKLLTPRAVAVVALAASIPLPCLASDARVLMSESERRLRAADESATYTMEMYEGPKLVHVRELIRLEKHGEDRSLTFVRFVSPVSVKNVSLLIEDKGEAFNNIWTYTPATKSLRRLAGSQKQNWFMGTDFTYEDFEGYKLGSYAFTQVETGLPCLKWPKCVVVEAVPTAAGEVHASGYTRKRYHLEATTLFPVLIEYFRPSGPVKRLETEGLQRHGSVTRATAQVMKSLDSDRSTRLVTRTIDVGKAIDPNVFTLKYLRYEQD